MNRKNFIQVEKMNYLKIKHFILLFILGRNLEIGKNYLINKTF